jgi:hypothetical protein
MFGFQIHFLLRELHGKLIALNEEIMLQIWQLALNCNFMISVKIT